MLQVLPAIALVVLFAVQPASADKLDDPARDPPPKFRIDPAGVVDSTHSRASSSVRRLGAWIDRFFSDEDYEAELNESRVLMSFDTFIEEYEGVSGKVRARIYLKLPALGDRFRAEVLGAADDDDIVGGGLADSSGPPPAADEQDIATALAYFFRNDEFQSTSARLGLTFTEYRPNPFVGVRYRRLVPLNDDWNFRFTEKARFFSLDGLVLNTTFSFEREIFEDQLFRTDISSTWLDREDEFSYLVGFSLFNPLNEKSVVEYQIINGFLTKPHKLNEVTLRFRYRRQTWRDWLTFEVAPQVAFRDSRDFRRVPGIFFRMEMVFGG